MGKKILLIAFMLCFAASGLYAQDIVVREEGVVEEENKTDLEMSDEGLVSLDFREADIKVVLKGLALKSGVNIVTSPEVKGTVTINLKDVPWKEALDVILQTYGYASEQRGNIITVTTVEDLKLRRENRMLLDEQAELITRTRRLNFAKASALIAIIESMKSERGKIIFDERRNMIIIMDVEDNINQILEVVDELDAPTPQVLIEAKIIETNLNDTDNLGIEWTSKVSIGGSKRDISWPFKTGSTDNPFAGDVSAPTAFTYGTLDFSQVSAVLEMLNSRTDTNILSNPRIVTLDNQTASIGIGTQYPIPGFGFNEETGTLQTQNITYKDVGILFNVTPTVSEKAGMVTLDLEPEVSEISGTVAFEGVDVPLINSKNAKTRVMVEDGNTLVIAGLIKSKDTDTVKKVPFLGDVPVLGHIFRKKEKLTEKTDLIIFVTPHIVTPEVPSSIRE